MLKKKTLLAQAKQATLSKRTTLDWFDKLDDSMRAQVKELMDSFLSGELSASTGQDWTAKDVNQLVLKPNGIEISDSSFRKWIAKYGKDAATASRESTAKKC